MKKIVILLLLLSTAVFQIASGQVPSVPMCTPVAEDFWLKASAEDLIRMMEQNHSEADKAYAFLLEKHKQHSKNYGSFYSDWDNYTRRVFKTSYKDDFKLVLLRTGLTWHIVQDVENLRILVNNLPKSDAFIIDSIINNLTSQKSLSDDQLSLLSDLFIDTDSLQKQKIFSYYQKFSSNAYVEYIMSSYAKDNYWHKEALAELLRRPSVSSSIAYLIQKFPLYVQNFWEKAHTDNICFKEEDITIILAAKVPTKEGGDELVPIDPVAHMYLVSVQKICLDELEKSGVFNDMKKTCNLAGSTYSGSFIDSFCERKLTELIKTDRGSLYDYVVVLSSLKIFSRSWASSLAFSDSNRLHAASVLRDLLISKKDQSVSIDTLIKCWASLSGYAGLSRYSDNTIIEKQMNENSMLLFDYIYKDIPKRPKDDVLVSLKKLTYDIDMIKKFTQNVLAAQTKKYSKARYRKRKKIAWRVNTSWDTEENIEIILNIFFSKKT